MGYDWKNELKRRREQIERALSSARSAMDNVSDSAGELSVADNHPADVADDVYDRGRQLGTVQDLQETISAIDDALVRVDRGEFGYCESCGNDIDEERLEAIPEARFCINCSKQHSEEWGRPEEEDVLSDVRSDDMRDTGERIRRQLDHWGTSTGPGEQPRK